MWPPSWCDETTAWGKNKKYSLFLSLVTLINSDEIADNHTEIFSNLVWHSSFRIQLTCTDCHILCIALRYLMPCVVTPWHFLEGIFYFIGSIEYVSLKENYLDQKPIESGVPQMLNLHIPLNRCQQSFNSTVLLESYIFSIFSDLLYLDSSLHTHLQLSCENDLETLWANINNVRTTMHYARLCEITIVLQNNNILLVGLVLNIHTAAQIVWKMIQIRI